MKEWLKKTISYGFIFGIMLFASYLFSRKEILLVIAVVLVMTLGVVYAVARAVTKKRKKDPQKEAEEPKPEEDFPNQ